ncbi:hypothetical protein K435DRAFT_844323 [Dendrothele bispora CBS 962.96]|uniref:Uncharacterized protein n=1 Tax=Dendrothele bispora (strain CBS 962.96) TaxID=1314807 RepID=A0A4S8L2T6_DENBC|nr:hypothetical protein K435DRAFT_844323 [Dendrothele bispora CBS 962.96]
MSSPAPTSSRRRRGRSRTPRSLSASINGDGDLSDSGLPPNDPAQQPPPSSETQPSSGTVSKRNRRRPGKKNKEPSFTNGLPGVDEWPHGDNPGKMPAPHSVNDWPHTDTQLAHLPGVDEWPHGDNPGKLPRPHGVNDWPHSDTQLSNLPGVSDWPWGDPVGDAIFKGSLNLPGVDDPNFPGSGDDKEGDDDQDKVIKLRLDLNIDVAVELNARVHGDVTLALLGINHPKLISKRLLSSQCAVPQLFPKSLFFFLVFFMATTLTRRRCICICICIYTLSDLHIPFFLRVTKTLVFFPLPPCPLLGSWLGLDLLGIPSQVVYGTT